MGQASWKQCEIVFAVLAGVEQFLDELLVLSHLRYNFMFQAFKKNTRVRQRSIFVALVTSLFFYFFVPVVVVVAVDRIVWRPRRCRIRLPLDRRRLLRSACVLCFLFTSSK